MQKVCVCVFVWICQTKLSQPMVFRFLIYSWAGKKADEDVDDDEEEEEEFSDTNSNVKKTEQAPSQRDRIGINFFALIANIKLMLDRLGVGGRDRDREFRFFVCLC